ncbi:hypothetical protein ANANG_G00019330 [Anguilla anguilla]|uniref:Uncharacterized protein n=1 Tax=Anguilla anguilla TaxID=7936 RepID=A0A9D3N224_ANGAN|nr:hypothetical protein ANANG_G00019330 [Anguilla anguilla]
MFSHVIRTPEAVIGSRCRAERPSDLSVHLTACLYRRADRGPLWSLKDDVFSSLLRNRVSRSIRNPPPPSVGRRDWPADCGRPAPRSAKTAATRLSQTRRELSRCRFTWGGLSLSVPEPSLSEYINSSEMALRERAWKTRCLPKKSLRGVTAA